MVRARRMRAWVVCAAAVTVSAALIPGGPAQARAAAVKRAVPAVVGLPPIAVPGASMPAALLLRQHEGERV